MTGFCSPSSSPPTPPSPLPISVGPGNHKYPISPSPSPSPSPPFSPPSSRSSPEGTPLLRRKRLPQERPKEPSAFSVHRRLVEESGPPPGRWRHLKDCLEWLMLRCCCCCSSSFR